MTEEGPTVMVHAALEAAEIVASITRRAAGSLDLSPGDPAHAILKCMSVARDHVADAAKATPEPVEGLD